MYAIALSWWPKRGPNYSRRYRYAGSKKRAWQIAKQIIARQDFRLKEFNVSIVDEHQAIMLHAWEKRNGKIKRTL